MGDGMPQAASQPPRPTTRAAPRPPPPPEAPAAGTPYEMHAAMAVARARAWRQQLAGAPWLMHPPALVYSQRWVPPQALVHLLQLSHVQGTMAATAAGKPPGTAAERARENRVAPHPQRHPCRQWVEVQMARQTVAPQWLHPPRHSRLAETGMHGGRMRPQLQVQL
jgi:hypothetical protein